MANALDDMANLFGLGQDSEPAHLRNPYRLGQNIGRGQYMQDLAELRRLKETGGPAVEEARALQRSAASKQIAMARGLNQGGRGLRMGTEAAGQSYVESEAPVAMIREAATQGYTEQEATAAGLLVMDDVKLQQTMNSLLENYRQTIEAQKQKESAAKWGALGTAAATAAQMAFKAAG